MALSDETREKLKGVSVATITTALFKRGLRNQFVQDVHPLNPSLGNMVGEAFTLRYIPAREDLNPIGVFKDRAHPQRKAIEECPPGAVMVIDSRKDARAASAGSILVARLMKRGCAGIVTDGGFRDSPEIAKLAIPAYHERPASPTNLTRHQALDIDVPIGCGDAPVFPGDVIVGDAEGVVVDVQRHRVGGVGLDLQRMRAGIGRGVDDGQRTLERLVVVARHLGNDEGAVAGADGTVADPEGGLAAVHGFRPFSKCCEQAA
jgi:regulator of RNase E activity RraA